MAPNPIEVQQSIQFGEGYELDLRPRRLRRGSHVLKLERIPLEILFLLVEHKDEIVTRDQIVSRIWGQGVFLDTDNSIRGAIRKLRQVLKDDADTPRFVQTVTGRGYRFIALVITPKEASGALASEPEASAVPTSHPDFKSELDDWLQSRRLRVVEQDQNPTTEKWHMPNILVDGGIRVPTGACSFEQRLLSQSRASCYSSRFGAGGGHRVSPYPPSAR
jgi:DNA-binding winged helix-turn-helix (wHTH) protein